MIPSSFHQQTITIEKSRDAVETNTEFREPVYRIDTVETVTIKAWVYWNTSEEPQVSRTDAELKRDGSIILRLVDMKKVGYTPRPGDRILKVVGNNAVDYMEEFTDLYIVNISHQGQYSRAAELFKAIIGQR
jgi:hypothetical protein